MKNVSGRLRMQNRITQKTKLLNEDGSLKQKGYATELILDYDRKDIKARPMRIKEWDYYYVGNSDFGIALTVADNSYMALLSYTFLHFREGINVTKSPMIPFTKGKLNLPSTSKKGDLGYKGKGYETLFKNDGKTRTLLAKYDNFYNGKPFEVNITLSEAPEDSMVIATPFPNVPTAFYYNQKINCQRAEGYAVFDGKRYEFSKSNNSMGVLDWGRGVWTYKNTWYWGSLSTYIGDHTFGFNIGYGFGDISAATENMLFYDGAAHKLSEVKFNIPVKDGKDDFMSDWTFTSDDNRFEFTFHPLLDRASNANLGIICSKQHQVFGEFTGRAILDDGTVIELNKTLGFAEKVFNKW